MATNYKDNAREQERAIVFRHNGAVQFGISPKDQQEFDLDELRAFVGGHIEVVKTQRISQWEETEAYVAYANEEGKIIGLPRNPVASYYVGRELVGDVVVVYKLGYDHHLPALDFSEVVW